MSAETKNKKRRYENIRNVSAKVHLSSGKNILCIFQVLKDLVAQNWTGEIDIRYCPAFSGRRTKQSFYRAVTDII
jgi:hypothetical protein